MSRLTLIAALALLGACQDAEGQAPREPKAATPPRAPPQEDPPRRQEDVSAQDYLAPPLPRARVVLKDAYGGSHPVEVEVASEAWSRTRGLMWRTELAEGKGMLFIFPREEVLSFWMRNTLIPLDMVFLDKRGVITGVVERAEPRTLTSRSVGRPSTYCLEVPGGWTAKIGLAPGSQATLEGLQGIRVGN